MANARDPAASAREAPQLRAADRIRATARDLFYREGVRAVGVDTIVARAGVTKPTLIVNQYNTVDFLPGGVAFFRGFDRPGVTGYGWMSPGELVDRNVSICKPVPYPPNGALANPGGINGACTLLVKEYPNLKREDERAAVDVMVEYAFGGLAQTQGWGAMDPAVWQAQIDTYAQLGQFTARTPKVEDVIWLEGLKATAALRMGKA